MGFAHAFGLTQNSQLDSDESHKFIGKTDPRCQATSHFGTGLYVDLWVNNAGVMGKNCIRDGKFLNSYIFQHFKSTLSISNYELEVQSRTRTRTFF